MSIQALYTAATGMNSMQAKLDVISNNLANAETTGFKADRANFEDLFYRAGQISRRAGQRQPAHTRRHRLWHRQPRAEHAEQLHPRLAAADRQRPGRGHPRERFLPGPRSLWHHLLHPRRQFLPKRQRRGRHRLGQHRPAVGAVGHYSERRHEHRHQRRRTSLPGARRAARTCSKGRPSSSRISSIPRAC